MLPTFLLPLFLASTPAVSAPARACTAVAIPEMVITLKNERGLVIGYGPEYRSGIIGPPNKANLAPPTAEELKKSPVLAVPTGKLHTYDIYVSWPHYQQQVLRNVVVPWDAWGCHPITRKFTVKLSPNPDAPPVREFKLTGMGRPFGIFLDATPDIVRQGVTWTSSRPDVAPVDPKTGVMTPKCLEKRDWTRLTATLNADPRYSVRANMTIEPNMRGCRN